MTPRDASTRTISWPVRWLAEGIVVVMSILVAFALDAWWDGRVERAALREAMNGVRSELTSNRALLEREMGSLDRIIGASTVLVDRLKAESDRASIQIVDTIAFLATNWAPSLEVPLGAVDALIASGRLAEIEDPLLRLGLAGLRDRFADVVEDELVARRIHVDQQAVVLAPRMDATVLARADDAFFSGVDYAVTPVPSWGDVAYPNTLELRNIVYTKASWYGSARGEIRLLIRHLDDLMARIDGEAT